MTGKPVFVICPNCKQIIRKPILEQHHKRCSCETANMINKLDYKTLEENKKKPPKPKLTIEERKQHKNEYNKNYRIFNKEILNAKSNTHISCVCGGKYTLKHKCEHEKSIRHQKCINTLN